MIDVPTLSVNPVVIVQVHHFTFKVLDQSVSVRVLELLQVNPEHVIVCPFVLRVQFVKVIETETPTSKVS